MILAAVAASLFVGLVPCEAGAFDSGRCLGALKAWGPGDDVARRTTQTAALDAPALQSRQLLAVRRSRGPRPRRRRPNPWDKLKKRCKAEGKVVQRIAANETAFAECLLSESNCVDDLAHIVSAARALDSIKRIQMERGASPDRCVTVHRGRCRSFRGNPETLSPFVPKLTPSQLPSEDIPKVYGTCAVVGNGPGLTGGEKVDVIDQHDAVFRFNYVQNVGKQGAKTTHRLLNNKRARLFFAIGKVRRDLKISPHETWLLWNYVSLDLYKPLRGYVSDTRVVHPAFIRHIVDSYFLIRKDLRRMGVKTGCPSNISSGIHGILLALDLCEQVNVFGFSFSRGMLHLKGQDLKGEKTKATFKSKHHDWGTDVLIIRLLAMAGVLNIC